MKRATSYVIVASAITVGVAVIALQYFSANPTVDSSRVELSGPSVQVVLTDDGFQPSEFSIKKGTTVIFSNTTGKPYWPASNLHPQHDIYSQFDPKQPLSPDATWSFTFDRIGDWGMHDHIRSYFTGVVHVTP